MTFDVAEIIIRVVLNARPIANSLSMLPVADLHLVSRYQFSLTMLFAIKPTADVDLVVFPFISSLAMKFVIFELADVFHAIIPDKLTKPVHLILGPVALILLLVFPDVKAVAREHAVLKLPLIE